MFQNMVNDLLDSKTYRIPSDVFKDTTFNAINEQEFQTFLKEVTFEKLKGKHLGELFQEKFGVQDRVLSIFKDDQDIIKHIRYCKYVK